LTSALAQIRAHGEAIECAVDLVDGDLVAEVVPGLHGVAPGQTLVVYDGDEVLGSATIDCAA
jgi:tRNA-specific 2-thiouridylase